MVPAVNARPHRLARRLLSLLALSASLSSCTGTQLQALLTRAANMGTMAPETELLLKYTNGLRASGVTCRGVDYPPSPPFHVDPALMRAAELRALDMARTRDFSHHPSNGKDMLYWIDYAGVDRSNLSWISENLAYVPNATIAAAGWLGSEDGHCEAQFTGRYNNIGLGEAKGPDGMLYFVALHTR